MPPRKLGEVLRELREAKGLTQSQLAAPAQIALSYVTVIEAGHGPHASPPRQIVERLARALGVPGAKRLHEAEK